MRLLRTVAGWRRSLSVRLTATVVAALVAVLSLTSLAGSLLVDPDPSIPAIAAMDPLAASVVAGPDGHAALVPDPVLAGLMARNPALRIAAFETATGRTLPGSDAELVAALGAVRRAGLNPADFNSDLRTTRFGSVLLLILADAWVWSELPRMILGYVRNTFWHFVAMGLALSLPTVGMVWLTLRPLRRGAALARQLGTRALDGRLPDDRMPPEVLPFVRSINGLLDRLEEDMQRHGRFIANAAHELRTPVAVLKTRLDLLPASALRQELAGDADRIAALVQQMLTIARFGDWALPMDQEIEVVGAVRGIVADYAPVAIDAGRALAFTSVERALTIRGNRQAFESAVFNVIDNALRAEPAGGSVEIVVGPGAMVAVIDHGAGIAPEDAARMFEPFWRKDHAAPGSGLGLPIVQEAMRLHGSEVRIGGTPGGGSTFTLDFSSARRA